MPITATQEIISSFLSKTRLVKVKSKAIRAGVWFKALRRIDRALVDLTIMVTSTITSVTLAKRLLVILGKLNGDIVGSFLTSNREFGANLAQKLSLLARQWGNIEAKKWPSDYGFVNFLAVMHGNERKTYKT